MIYASTLSCLTVREPEREIRDPHHRCNVSRTISGSADSNQIREKPLTVSSGRSHSIQNPGTGIFLCIDEKFRTTEVKLSKSAF